MARLTVWAASVRAERQGPFRLIRYRLPTTHNKGSPWETIYSSSGMKMSGHGGAGL